MHLPKRLRTDLGGALREFTVRESNCFQPQNQTEGGRATIFTSQERQWLVLHILQTLRAHQKDLETLQGRANVAEGQSILASWQITGLVTQIFPLHYNHEITRLQNNWVTKVFAPQPLGTQKKIFYHCGSINCPHPVFRRDC